MRITASFDCNFHVKFGQFKTLYIINLTQIHRCALSVTTGGTHAESSAEVLRRAFPYFLAG